MQLSSEQSACLSLIHQVLVAAHNVSRDRQFFYLLLQNNIDKLNNRFASLLKTWAVSILQKITPNEAHDLAADIVLFSNFLFEFQLGERAENIEVVMEKILGNEWIKLNHRSRSNQCCFMYLGMYIIHV